MPAKAGIQERIAFTEPYFLDTGLRRYDESFFNTLLATRRFSPRNGNRHAGMTARQGHDEIPLLGG